MANYWIDLLGLALALMLVNGAITGRFYTHGRGGGRRLITVVQSLPARVGFLAVSAGLIVWLIIDLRQKLGVH